MRIITVHGKSLSRLVFFALLLALVSFAAVSFSGCGDSDGAKITETIGPDGGVIVSSDGNLTLTIPAGALAADTDITIEGKLSGPITLRNNRSTDEEGNEDEDTDEVIYRLEPSGLQFALPVMVAYNLQNDPISDGTAAASVSSMELVTADAGELVADQGIVLDLDGRTSLLTGNIVHFSELIIRTNLPRTIGFAVFADGIPDSLAVGGKFVAEYTINHPANSRFSADPVFYADSSVFPIQFVSATNLQFGALVSGQQSFYEEKFTYECVQAGTGIYNGLLIFQNASLRGQKANYYISFFKKVSCGTIASTPTPSVSSSSSSSSSESSGGQSSSSSSSGGTSVPPTPTVVVEPMPTVQATPTIVIPDATPTVVTSQGCAALDGAYNGNGGCGFGSTNASVSGTALVLNPLGSNSNVVFLFTGNSASANGSDFIIFGAAGHRMFLSCNNGAQSFVLHGERANNPNISCNETFTR